MHWTPTLHSIVFDKEAITSHSFIIPVFATRSLPFLHKSQYVLQQISPGIHGGSLADSRPYKGLDTITVHEGSSTVTYSYIWYHPSINFI